MKLPFDEMLDASGKARPHYQAFHQWLKQQSDTLMGLKRAEADLIFRRVGITFAVYGDDLGSERTIPFDQVPRIFTANEWEQLEAGLRQRVKALNCFIYDVYHDEDKLVEGVATIAAAFYPKPVIVRLSDFKSNEYKKLIGGSRYEPDEENPMLGFRGASRYISGEFQDAFAMECEALKRARNEMGLSNIEIMVPFVRTVRQAERVVAMLAERGLKRGVDGLRIIMMCEVPSNAILAEQFLEHFDGMSIGSNDLTQLTLGLDRDSGLEQLAGDFDERDPAVKALISRAIAACRAAGKYVGICGQGPSDHPDFADWLADEGIGSISLNPDSVVETWHRLAKR